MSRRNPSVKGLPCAVCGRGAESFSHEVHKGMGGDPTNKRTAGFPSCGVDHSNKQTCHGAYGHHMLRVRFIDGGMEFLANDTYALILNARGIKARPGEWMPARFFGKTYEELGFSV